MHYNYNQKKIKEKQWAYKVSLKRDPIEKIHLKIYSKLLNKQNKIGTNLNSKYI